MNRFNFWQKWLLIASLFLVIFGIGLAFLNQTSLFDFLFNHRINPYFWHSLYVSQDIAQFQGWIYGVLGATVAGWGIFMAFIAHYPFRARERWSWNCLTTGLLVWYLVDTAISLYFGVYFNALFNTGLFLLLAIPLAFSRKYFLIRPL